MCVSVPSVVYSRSLNCTIWAGDSIQQNNYISWFSDDIVEVVTLNEQLKGKGSHKKMYLRTTQMLTFPFYNIKFHRDNGEFANEHIQSMYGCSEYMTAM